MSENELYNIEKLIGRFGLTRDESEKVKLMTMLHRVPPIYEETIKIVRKNEKMLSMKK